MIKKLLLCSILLFSGINCQRVSAKLFSEARKDLKECLSLISSVDKKVILASVLVCAPIIALSSDVFGYNPFSGLFTHVGREMATGSSNLIIPAASGFIDGILKSSMQNPYDAAKIVLVLIAWKMINFKF